MLLKRDWITIATDQPFFARDIKALLKHIYEDAAITRHI